MLTATTHSVNRCHRNWPALGMLVFATVVNAGELSCHGETLISGSEAHTIDLTLTVAADGRVTALTFYDLQSDPESDNPLAIHVCSLDTGLPESYGQARWSGPLVHQQLDLVDAFDGERSSIKIAKRESGYSIQFGIMSRSYCGQVNFPAAVVISADSDQCRVHFPWPETPR